MFGERIASLATAKGRGLRLQEVVVGLGFTMVCLDSRACGLAYTLRDELERGCEAFAEAGRLQGRDVEEVLAWTGKGSIIASAVGLATANALLGAPDETFGPDLFDLLRLKPGERLVTVGRFRPMEPALKKMGVVLEVIEPGDSKMSLSVCDVALITATSIINGTLQGLLGDLGNTREVVILGPSTPYAPAAFSGTPVTILAGSDIVDAAKVRTIVREGGGTQTLGKSLRRWVTRIGDSEMG
jgi:hypothetical protein